LDKLTLPSIKKKHDPRKVYGHMTKTILYPGKQKKNSLQSGSDYILYGKKANLSNFGSTLRMKD
jgi:hypothetical protein